MLKFSFITRATITIMFLIIVIAGIWIIPADYGFVYLIVTLLASGKLIWWTFTANFKIKEDV